MGHLPLYAVVNAKKKPGEVLENADEMEQLMKNIGVDMYIAGHQHAYFPAQSKSITLLHSSCLGGGPRPFINHPEPPRKAYTWIEIPKRNARKNVKIEGFDGVSNEVIPLKSLPKAITGFNGIVYRWK